jgi:hypothetical protein
MPDYQRGKIYKITSGDLTYIGSTCEPNLARRLAEHVCAFKRWKAGTLKTNYSVFPLIETSQYEITLVELCPCNSKDELTARERFHIETTICVNKNIAGRTKEEYVETNRPLINEKRRIYREENPELIKECKKASYLKHRDKHKDTLKEKQKAYYQATYEANKDKINERRRIKRQQVDTRNPTLS